MWVMLVFISMRKFATAQFQRFFDCGKAIRCLLPRGGRFLNLVVLYGYHCADTDAEQLALTEQLFDAALGFTLSSCWGFQRRAHQEPLSE